MSGYDGSVRINTKIDTSGFNKGTSTIKNGLKSLSSSLKTLAGTISATFMISKILSFSNAASELASNTEASVKRLIDIYGEASKEVGEFIDFNARTLGISKAAAASYSAVYGNLFSAWADQATNAELTNQYLNMTAVVASKTGRTVEDVQERVRSGLLGNTEAIEDLGVFVNVKTIEMTDAFKRMADGKSWEQLDTYSQQQIRTMAILEQATAKYGTEVAETSTLTRMRWQAAYEDFQNTWGQVVNTVFIPLLKVGTMVLNVLTKGLQVIAKLSGKTIDTTVAQSDAISTAVDNQNALTDAVKETAKAQESALAGFDEINTLSKGTNSDSSSDSGGSSAGIGNLGLEETGASLDGSSYVDEIDKTLATIMGIVGIALAGVGLILLFTGHIGWGIGFIIAGAAVLGVTMAAVSKTGIGEDVIGVLTTIMGFAGGALLALGIILLYIGGVVGKGIAIGMIIAGGALIVSAVVAKAAISPNDIKGWLTTILGIAAGALLALGIILCMVGSTPIGVGMIIAGAVALVSAVALNFNAVSDKIKGWVAVIMAIAGAALLVLGIILCATGGAIPLGIALIAVGAVALVTPIALNRNAIKDKVKEVFNSICDWIKTWGLLVLGIILCLSGAGIPLGIALMKKGASNLTAAKNPTWNAILDKLKEVWAKIGAWWNSKVAKYLTSEYWGQKGKDMINGLIKWIITGLNKLIEKINSFGFNLPDVLGGGHVGFNLSKITIPKLAQGAVIPPNKEFLAVLGDQKSGTNIEAPLDTIKQAVAEVLAQVNINKSDSTGRIEIPVIINGREIARAVRESESNMGTQTVYGGFANAY